MVAKKKVTTPRRKPKPLPRKVGPYSGVQLRKPSQITLQMLERWDVCYDAYVWLRDHGGVLPLNDRAISAEFERTHTSEFKINWLININNLLFTDLINQTQLNSARVAINKMRSEFNAAVTALMLDKETPSHIKADKKLLLALRLIDNLEKI